MKSCLAPILAAALVISLAGCKEDAVDTAAYEPTSEHCQPDYLKTLPDNKAREDLVTSGLRQSAPPHQAAFSYVGKALACSAAVVMLRRLPKRESGNAVA